MDNENLENKENVFKNLIDENGLKYYQFPIGFPLFKACKYINPLKPEITLEPNTPYFFGLKNMNNKYISSYEQEYGVIFEFKTLIPYKLLALDDPKTLAKLFENSPTNIQQILSNNYGYNGNLMTPNERNSVGNSDKELAIYLCKIGYQGYAIYKMATDFGGTFHPELLICNSKGIQFIKQITTKQKMNQILEDAKLFKISSDMRSDRSSNKKQRIDLNLDNDPTFKKGPLFGADEDDEDEDDEDDEDDDEDDEMELDGGKTVSKKKTSKKKTSKKKTSKKKTSKKKTSKKKTVSKKNKTNRKKKRNRKV